MIEQKPNFLIVGAQKAGTTSLHYYLKQHPQIYMSPVKEPHFFTEKPKNCPNTISNEKKYLELFKNVQDEIIIGESSASYLHCKKAPFRIKEYLKNPKILIVLRNPIERAYSSWLMDVREGRQKLPFREAIEKYCIQNTKKGFCVSPMYIEYSIYYEAVKTYLELFGKENVKVMFFDNLKEYPYSFVKEIFKFLNVDPNFDININKKYNIAGVPKNKLIEFIYYNKYIRNSFKKIFPLNEETKEKIKLKIFKKPEKKEIEIEDKEFLKNIFEEDIKILSKLLNKDLKHWLE